MASSIRDLRVKLPVWLVCGLVFSCANGSKLDSGSAEIGDGEGASEGDGDGDGDGNGNGNGNGTTGAGGFPGGGGAPGSGGAPTTGSAECCAPTGVPGCAADPTVEACVCAQDDFCCMTEWDETCVGDVNEFGCGACAGGLGGGDPGLGGGDPGTGGAPPVGGGECCTAEVTPGCVDPAIEQCVCDLDSYCCLIEWDDTCVGEVDEFGCGTCL